MPSSSQISTNELLGEIEQYVGEKLDKWGRVALYNGTIVTVARPPRRDYDNGIDLNSPQARLWLSLENSFSERAYESILTRSNLTAQIERTQPWYDLRRPDNMLTLPLEDFAGGEAVVRMDKLIEAKRQAEIYERIDMMLGELRGKSSYTLKAPQYPGTRSLVEFIPRGTGQLTLETALRYTKRTEWQPKQRSEKHRKGRPDIIYIFPKTGANMEAEVKPGSQIWSGVEALAIQLQMYYLSNAFRGYERNSLGVVEPVILTRREQDAITAMQKEIKDMTILAQTISSVGRLRRSTKGRLHYLERKKKEVGLALREAEDKRLHDSIEIFKQQLQIIGSEQDESKKILEFIPKLMEE